MLTFASPPGGRLAAVSTCSGRTMGSTDTSSVEVPAMEVPSFGVPSPKVPSVGIPSVEVPTSLLPRADPIPNSDPSSRQTGPDVIANYSWETSLRSAQVHPHLLQEETQSRSNSATHPGRFSEPRHIFIYWRRIDRMMYGATQGHGEN